MAILVGDVGGTNSRLAIASAGGLETASIRRFTNAQYGTFHDVIDEYLALEKIESVTDCCIAVAGPVTAQTAKLTNIDWDISAKDLRRHLSCDHAQILNDLTALGHSLGHLSERDLAPVCKCSPEILGNGQSLVVGIGTGFNVCPVVTVQNNRKACLEAEYGHTSLSQNILHCLSLPHPPMAQNFRSVEDLFSGDGLSRLHALLTEGPAVSGAEIVSRYRDGTDEHAKATLSIFAQALGALMGELVLKYLPLDGVYFSGSVTRALFESGFGPQFVGSLEHSSNFNPDFSNLPISVIKDDSAALMGCLSCAELR